MAICVGLRRCLSLPKRRWQRVQNRAVGTVLAPRVEHTLSPVSTRISALTCSFFLERHVNEEILPPQQHIQPQGPLAGDREVLAG